MTRISPARALRARHAFTLIELLVVVSIIALLAAILFPVFAQAREKARQTACLSNMKQLGLMSAQYMQDFDDHLPLTIMSGGMTTGQASWLNAVQPYVKSRAIFRCLSDKSQKPWAQTDAQFAAAYGTPDYTTFRRTSYLLNAWLIGPDASGFSKTLGSDTTIPSPARVIYLAEAADNYDDVDHFQPMCWGAADPNYVALGYPACTASPGVWNAATGESKELAAHRHQDGANYLYMDGHAHWSKWGQVYYQDAAHNVYEGAFDPHQP